MEDNLTLDEYDPSTIPLFASILIFGKRRSGKGVWTNYHLPRMITKHKWTDAHIFSPTCCLPEQEKNDWKFIPKQNKHDTFSEQELHDIIEKQKEDAVKWASLTKEEQKEKPQPRLLIVMDDLLAPDRKTGSDTIFRSKTVSDMFVSGRHSFITVVCLLQSITSSVSTICRKNTDLIVFFRSPSVSDIEILARDYLYQPQMKLGDIKEFIHKSTMEKHSCLCINVTDGQWAKDWKDFVFVGSKHKPMKTCKHMIETLDVDYSSNPIVEIQEVEKQEFKSKGKKFRNKLGYSC